MKQFLLAICAILPFFSFSQANQEVRSTLDSIIAHVEEASLYRNTVDWDTLRPNIYKLAADVETTAELKPALKYLLKSIGDEHGRVFHNNQILANYNSGITKPHQATFQPNLYNNVQMGQVYSFHAELLEENIGYIRIVGLPMGDNEKMTAEIQDEVCRLLNEGAEKWIVDLRYNGGGNMHPMAEGLALIIGEGMVGGSQGLTPEESSTWTVKDNNFYYDDFSIEYKEACNLDVAPKVAVLTSLYTVSSGEALAVIFKGRPQTKFFGEKTLGLITVTDWHIIDEITAMTISVSYYKDRNEQVYDEYVDVDVEVPFEEEPLSENDSCVRQAIDWLKR